MSWICIGRGSCRTENSDKELNCKKCNTRKGWLDDTDPNEYGNKIQKKIEFMDDNEISYDSSFNPIRTDPEDDDLMEEFNTRIGLD